MLVRIKTLKEFGGSRPAGWSTFGSMDYLYGQTIEVKHEHDDMYIESKEGWVLRESNFAAIDVPVESAQPALTYAVVQSASPNQVCVQITHQAFRVNKFFHGEDEFKAKDGLRLSSCDAPEVRENTGNIFLLGCCKTCDTNLLKFNSIAFFNRFVVAVAEYNIEVAKPQNSITEEEKEQALIKAKKNLIKHCQDLANYLNDRVFHIDAIITPERFAALKKDIMDRQVQLPLTNKTCYHCLVNKFNCGRPGEIPESCQKCEYATSHGACLVGGSTYDDILNAQRALRIAIEKY
jgi:hypothetical protein